MELEQFLSKIDWGHVQRIHATKDGSFYSLAVDVNRKKHIVSVGTGPKASTLTISDNRGNILFHSVQEGRQLWFYSPKPGSVSVV